MRLYNEFERTLFLKWNELQANKRELGRFYTLKRQIFNPQTPGEIEQVKVEIVPVNADNSEIFRALYRFTSSNVYNGAPGETMRYLIKDGTSGKYLGLIRQQSDPSPASTVRDDFIGWTAEQRLTGHKIDHVYNGQTLVAFKPFSYNFLGGKLLARLVVTDYFRKQWLTETGHLPVAAITTSLYGSEKRLTQYDNLKGWLNLGQTVGRSPLPLPQNLYERWRKDYGVEQPVMDDGDRCDKAKRQVANIIAKELRLPGKFLNFGILRGIYWCPFYANTNSFLCDRIDESKLRPLPKIGDMEWQVATWKREAIDRFRRLQEDGRVQREAIYYNKAVGMTFKQMRQAFMSELSQN
jgi:hypothetical protein